MKDAREGLQEYLDDVSSQIQNFEEKVSVNGWLRPACISSMTGYRVTQKTAEDLLNNWLAKRKES